MERDKPDLPLGPIRFRLGEPLREDRNYLKFAMFANGYYTGKPDGRSGWHWTYDPKLTQRFVDEFKGRSGSPRGASVSLFGPNDNADTFFSERVIDPYIFIRAFSQTDVMEAVKKYEFCTFNGHNLGERLSYIFGGVIRHLNSRNAPVSMITDAVKFTAQMTKIAEPESAETVAMSTAMYIISGGSVKEDRDFMGRVYRMSEAISEDPVVPVETRDMGLSQVARLRAYSSRISGNEVTPLPDVSAYLKPFAGFPTVGAEFHLLPHAVDANSTFWKRLAVLNMSQYQSGSYVQFSRNDRGVIEIRMNPSVYPVSVANWNWIKELLPELNRAYFHATINRAGEDFNWGEDRPVLDSLRALGMLVYAGQYEDVVRGKREEINFGEVYLGQTVRFKKNGYAFSGLWGGDEGRNGQLSVYAGFGQTFDTLVYYMSMALANPDILRPVRDDLTRAKTLHEALGIQPIQRTSIFTSIQDRIDGDERLWYALKAGNRIIQQLNPGQ